MKTLHELFEDGLKDMYNAEKQLVKALPKMAKLAKNQRLKQGFENHLRETEAHAQRVEMACQKLGIKASGMVCRAMKGLVEEATEHMSGLKAGACADAELIALAQKVEHYEIGSYGTLCRWAETMGHDEVLGLLKNNLSDEERTDQLLTQVAESEVNEMAARESNQWKMEGKGQKGTTRGRRASTTKRATGARKPARATGRASTARKSTARASTGRPTSSRSKTTTSRGKTTSRASTTGRSRASAR